MWAQMKGRFLISVSRAQKEKEREGPAFGSQAETFFLTAISPACFSLITQAWRCSWNSTFRIGWVMNTVKYKYLKSS